jgi:hypothetical protein
MKNGQINNFEDYEKAAQNSILLSLKLSILKMQNNNF